MPAKKKKSLVARLVKELDDKCKALILSRDRKEFGTRCSLCEEDNHGLMWCHLISATKYATRWDPINIYAQCRGCNFRHEFHPQYYTAWWINRHGEEAYQALVRKSSQPANYKSKDLKLILEAFS